MDVGVVSLFSDYHIVCVIIKSGALTLVDFAHVLCAYPELVDGFCKHRHCLISAFNATGIEDMMTGISWAIRYVGYDCVIPHLPDVTTHDRRMDQCIEHNYYATFVALLSRNAMWKRMWLSDKKAMNELWTLIKWNDDMRQWLKDYYDQKFTLIKI